MTMTTEPIIALTEHLQNVQKDKKTQGTPEKINRFFDLLYNKKPVTDSPQDALGIQYGVARATVKIDLDAKIAGALGQGINKLVSMQ